MENFKLEKIKIALTNQIMFKETLVKYTESEIENLKAEKEFIQKKIESSKSENEAILAEESTNNP